MHRLIRLNNLISTNKKPIRAGRGDRSKRGNFAGKGDAGQKQRRGDHGDGPEGGFPTYRRFKKKGFTPINRRVFSILKTSEIGDIADRLSVDRLTKDNLKSLLHGSNMVKILFDKKISRKIYVQADAVSKQASEYVEIYK